jgi:hypothetical protein
MPRDPGIHTIFDRGYVYDGQRQLWRVEYLSSGMAFVEGYGTRKACREHIRKAHAGGSSYTFRIVRVTEQVVTTIKPKKKAKSR